MNGWCRFAAPALSAAAFAGTRPARTAAEHAADKHFHNRGSDSLDSLEHSFRTCANLRILLNGKKNLQIGDGNHVDALGSAIAHFIDAIEWMVLL
ncbi:hypothetical protein D3870_21230 [Noviherbaspirillum cavernae]|uniref:Uncharacterized protein n=1 Tax=Noviherbaspirillum cavernae TaxID=2320862 RepID=A0A418WW22_9BURK|nr:hypothetical protein D3870_21230 [Noviherbaspirillum cavernae]